MKELYFKKNENEIEALKEDIKRYSNQKGLELQELDDPEKGWVCQMEKKSSITLGIASRAVTVLISDFSNDTIKVSIGEAKWVSKLAGGLVVLFSPAALVTLIALPVTLTGVFKQKGMLKDLENLVNVRLK